jgi:hypothetical protein
MKLIKELLDIAAQHELNESDTIKLDLIKPRNKRGEEILRSKRSVRHYNARKDYVRAKEKDKTRRDQ